MNIPKLFFSVSDIRKQQTRQISSTAFQRECRNGQKVDGFREEDEARCYGKGSVE